MKIKLLIVDDHPMILFGLRSMLNGARGIEIIDEALNGKEAVELAMKLKPDVIIMDLSMPKLNGFNATRRVLEKLPNIKVIALSMHLDKWNVQRAFNAGMSGYMSKNCTADELATAIRTVFADGIYISKKLIPLIDTDKLPPNSKIKELLKNYNY